MGTDNYGGIIWFLGALIILTLSGVFLSMLADKGLDSSKAGGVVADAFAENAAVLYELQAELGRKTERHSLVHARTVAATSGMESERAFQTGVKDRIASLTVEKIRLRNAIPSMESEFAEYRSRYRKNVWAKATGERMGDLFIKSGRQFEQVVINRVTPLGLDISHAHGLAKVDFMELSLALRERFQWDEQERARILATEQESQLDRPLSAVSSAEKTGLIVPQGADIASVRAEIILWRSRISTLRIELSQAESQSRHGSNRSVPGSLRTWGEQAALLRQDITRSEARLALALEKLRDASPSDPALVRPR